MASSNPCTNDPNEVIEKIVQAQTDAEKLDQFVNGGVLDEVQLGEGQPTPTLRNVVHLVKSAGATLDGTDVSGKSSDAANGGTTLRMLSERFGDFVNLKDFGAIGDGSANDAPAWDAFQAAIAGGAGIGYIPSGVYKIQRTVGNTTTTEYKRFTSGCIGNGDFAESPPAQNFSGVHGYWTQVARNPTAAGYLNGNADANAYDNDDNQDDNTILKNRATYSAGTSSATHCVRGPQIKTQTEVSYTMTNANDAFNFTRVIGAYHEGIGSGSYSTTGDNKTGNFTTFAATAHNKFAGPFGMGAITGRVWDAKESEVPEIDVTLVGPNSDGVYTVSNEEGAGYGASKSCGGYFPFIRRSKHRNGGYMIGIETYCMNTADETEDVPYLNNDTFTFRREPNKQGTGGSWTCGFHCTAYGGSTASGGPKGAPISAGIVLDCAGGARHGFWNGIVIGSSSMKINGDTEGYSGTVGINFGSWRGPREDDNGNQIAGRYGDQAIRFGYANQHLHFKSGARIWSPATVIGYDGLSDDDETVEYSGLMIMAPEGGQPYLNFATGTLAGTRTNKFGIGVFPSNGNVLYNLHSGSSHVFAFTAAPAGGGDPETTYVYNLNTGFFTCSGEQSLGTATTRWGQIYSTNSTISTSDERLKQDIEAMPDALLDAWDGIDWRQFRFKDAVAEKGDAARTHTGLIAQRVKAVLDGAGLDAVQYGFLCHDEWEDQYEPVTVVDEPEHLDENDELVPDKVHEEARLVKPAGDAWSLRYEEALCIEAAYVRRELARIKAQIGMNA